MITERLFCVKVILQLNPCTASHPEIHHKGKDQDDHKSDKKCAARCPFLEVAKRLKEIHSKIAGDEGQRHEQNRNDRQCFHDLIHTVVDDRQIGILRAAHQVTQAFIQIM